MRVVDFFCGSGGFSEGFRQAGYEIVFAVDKWEPAVTTYKGNKPGVNVIQDDIIRISNLEDKEFDYIVPDSEVIIGSPPCQAFSHSNKSGNADKSIGIELINAYLRIIARKKFKMNSILRYWILENVPNVKEYIKDSYSAQDLGLEGDFILYPKRQASGIYNAKYFGAPTNRERYFCGEFPVPIMTHNDTNIKTFSDVLYSLNNPLSYDNGKITDINYPNLKLQRDIVTDYNYIYELAPFEWQTAKRLKQDKGYMGNMSFPENIEKPSRTVMATMSTSSRESIILPYKKDRYRLPTVREVASVMSFPIDYKFYGKSKAIKHTLVGNAVPPKMAYALAKSIAKDCGLEVPDEYLPIKHDDTIEFVNLNGVKFPQKVEKVKRDIAKFKYHIPYLIISSYRVELTNYKSDFNNKNFKWDVEIHYSQGRNRAAVYKPDILLENIGKKYHSRIDDFITRTKPLISTSQHFQEIFCMTNEGRKALKLTGPFELLETVKIFLKKAIPKQEWERLIFTCSKPEQLPLPILIGYYVLTRIINIMEDDNGF